MYYTGDGVPRPEVGRKLPGPRTDEAGKYIADDALIDAVNVALMLSQPLLVTGEPGTGKTQLARAVANELGLPMEKFEVKSDSVARDLFYSYDSLARFHAAQPGAEASNSSDNIDPLQFIEFQALGKAILAGSENTAFRPADLPEGLHRVLVLIDEIDKAPRDLPNDILNQIEDMFFRIPEIGVNARVDAVREYRPVVIITSNSEKSLPEAFLRRCAFFHIEFPRGKRLQQVVESRIGGHAGTLLLEQLLALFQKFRDQDLRKKPGTAELLDWLQYLEETKRCDWDAPLAGLNLEVALKGVSSLAKDRNDQKLFADLAASDAGTADQPSEDDAER